MPEARTPPSISAFFPALNDEGTIARMVTDALAVLSTLTDDYEVLVVNDGSTDGTAAVLDALARQQPRLGIIHHSGNRGYGAALVSGFRHASKDLIFYTDGDGQYDVQDLRRLTPLMTRAVDVVNGYKRKRADGGHRVVLGEIYKRLARWLFGLPIRDVDCDFRLLRREAMQRIELVSVSGVVCTEMIYKLSRAGCRFAEVAVPHYPRPHGHSQFFTVPRVARTAIDFVLLWVKLRLLPTRAPATVDLPPAPPARASLD
ncbi:MAG: glycosyltransferase family 2 protein [Candidatus Rokuibacteriota bacterium]